MDTIKAQDRKREQRDTFLLLPILIIGILVMCLAGTLGIRLARQWMIPTAEMGSVIDPDKNYHPGAGEQGLAPLSADILTPFPWNTFLTPEGNSWNPTVVPIIIFRPVNTATATPAPLTTITPQATGLPTKTFTPYPSNTWVVIIYPTLTPVPTRTNLPNPTKTRTPTITATRTKTGTPTTTGTSTVTPTSTATGTVTATPTVTMTSTITMTPTVTQTGTATLTPTVSETATITATATETLTPTSTSTPTVTPTETQTSTVTPSPTIIPPPGNVNIGPGNGAVTTFPDGSSIILDMGSTPISAHGGYDMVYYEMVAGPGINLDRIQIEISADLVTWYTVFYWGNGVLDANSSVGTGTYPATEPDNQPINAADLYGTPRTGVMIDIDALGLTGSYRYVRLTVPVGGGDGADVDAVGLYP